MQLYTPFSLSLSLSHTYTDIYSFIGQTVCCFPHRSFSFFFFFMLDWIAWQFCLPIAVESFQLVVSGLLDTTQQLHRSTCSVSPVGWGYRIHWLHLCRGVSLPLPMSVLDLALNNLIGFSPGTWGECEVPLHCHCSQVHSDPEW